MVYQKYARLTVLCNGWSDRDLSTGGMHARKRALDGLLYAVFCYKVMTTDHRGMTNVILRPYDTYSMFLHYLFC